MASSQEIERLALQIKSNTLQSKFMQNQHFTLMICDKLKNRGQFPDLSAFRAANLCDIRYDFQTINIFGT